MLEEKITNLQTTPAVDVLYDNKFTYRTALAESFKTEGVYLKDWDNFRPFYDPNPPNIKINELIQNANSAISKVGTDNLIDYYWNNGEGNLGDFVRYIRDETNYNNFSPEPLNILDLNMGGLSAPLNTMVSPASAESFASF